jgi:hypothetical protein
LNVLNATIRPGTAAGALWPWTPEDPGFGQKRYCQQNYFSIVLTRLLPGATGTDRANRKMSVDFRVGLGSVGDSWRPLSLLILIVLPGKPIDGIGMAGDGRNLDQNAVALTSGGKTTRLLKSGDIIGDSYRLKGLIGRGGMGFVFRAEHIIIGQDYALKMLAPDQINEVTWGRFQAEGKAIARLNHPNIVKIYNMGVDRGDCPYYVMDLLDGVALSDCIKDKTAFTIDEILNLFIQIAPAWAMPTIMALFTAMSNQAMWCWSIVVANIQPPKLLTLVLPNWLAAMNCTARV